MTGMRFFIVDVFAERPHAGNQLAVFLEAGKLSTEQMQAIAREMNFSESSFVLSGQERDGGFDVRIFTPKMEVPFAGHPTIGTAFVIRQELQETPSATVRLNLALGRIPVIAETGADGKERLWMHQKPPVFGDSVPAGEVSAVLGLDRNEIDMRFPAQEVSTGLPFLIVPLRSLHAVQNSRIDPVRYEALVDTYKIPAIFVFAAEAREPENQIHARMFADRLGVAEDPATGSANGCLAGYLVQHRYFERDSVQVRVEQGYEIDRPSLLYLRAADTTEGIDIHVGGRVFPAARGTLL